MKSKEEIEAGLVNFFGTESYHRYSPIFRNHVLTDGALWFAESADAYWLMDAICSYHSECMRDDKKMLQDSQYWTIRRNESGNGAVLICERDTGDVFVTQEIEYTDFPLSEFKLWCNRADENLWVIMLPSEY